MKKLITIAFSLLTVHAFAETCTNVELSNAADKLLPHTKAELAKELKIESDHGVTWEIVTNPRPEKSNRGKRDMYSFEMVDSDGYDVPVYAWTAAGTCKLKPKSIHIDKENGDDG